MSTVAMQQDATASGQRSGPSSNAVLRNTKRISNGLSAWKDELLLVAQQAGVETYIFQEIHARRVKAAIRCADAMQKADEDAEARIAALEALMKDDKLKAPKAYSAPSTRSKSKSMEEESSEDESTKPYTGPCYINSEGYLAPATFEEWSHLEPTWDKNSKALFLLKGGLDRSDLEAIKDIAVACVAFKTVLSRHKQPDTLRKLQLVTKLNKLSLPPGNTTSSAIETLMVDVQATIAQLRSLDPTGKTFDEDMEIAMIYAKLPGDLQDLTLHTLSSDGPHSIRSFVQQVRFKIQSDDYLKTHGKHKSLADSAADASQTLYQSSTEKGMLAQEHKSQLKQKSSKKPRKRHSLHKPSSETKQSSPPIESKSQSEGKPNPNTAYFARETTLAERSWVIDSGATSHMTPSQELISDLSHDASISITSANGEEMISAGFGHAAFAVPDQTSLVPLSKVWHVPNLTEHLLSVSALNEDGFDVLFSAKHGPALLKDSVVVATGRRVGKGFVLDGTIAKVQPQASEFALFTKEKAPTDALEWHRRLCHMSIKDMKRLSKSVDGFPDDLVYPEYFDCSGCAAGKSKRSSFPSVANSATQRLDIVHIDVAGPMRTNSINDARYFLIIVDGFSKYVWAYMLKDVTADTVCNIYKAWETVATNHVGDKVKIVRSDGGNEFKGSFRQHLITQGTTHQTTVPHTPEQNGVAERHIRTVVEKARSSLLDETVGPLPRNLWAELTSTAVYAINRSPHTGLDKTPYELWYGKRPDCSHMRTPGTICWSHNPRIKDKWDARANKAMFLGYSDTSKAWRVLDLATGKVVLNHSVIFDHAVAKELSVNKDVDPRQLTDAQLEAIASGNAASVEFTDEQLEAIATSGLDVTTNDDELDEYAFMLTAQDVLPAPVTVKQALSRSDAPEWRASMERELASLEGKGVFEYVAKLPLGRKAIGARWIFKNKILADGTFDKRKSRLVAKGYSQKAGVDYNETYAPVTRLESVRMLIALASIYKLHLHQMDIATAYLNANLFEEIFMIAPPGFSNENFPFVRLKKALYGLKQAGKAWNDELHATLTAAGYERSMHDFGIYQHKTNSSLLCVYVDDILMACSDLAHKEHLLKALTKRYELSDLGPANSILGMRVSHSNGVYTLDQSTYIESIATDHGLANCHPRHLPASVGTILTTDGTTHQPTDDQLANKTAYQSIVGELQWIAISTRPDVAYIVGVLGRFSAKPTISHMKLARGVLAYLFTTRNLRLRYDGNDEFAGYSDSDYSGCLDTRKSTSGYVFMLGGAAITWQSKRQNIVATSTMEAEYIGLSNASKEALWLRELMLGIKISNVLNSDGSINLFGDNQAALKLAHNPVFHAKSKHIEVKYHHTRSLIEQGKIKLHYVGTKLQKADLLTKLLPRPALETQRLLLGLV